METGGGATRTGREEEPYILHQNRPRLLQQPFKCWSLVLAFVFGWVSFVLYFRMRVCGRTLKVKRSTLVVQQEGRAVTSSAERNATRDPKNRIAFRHRPIAAVQPSAASRGFFSREHIITHRRRSLVVTIPHLSHAPTQHCGPSAGNSDPPFSAGITPTFLSSELQQGCAGSVDYFCIVTHRLFLIGLRSFLRLQPSLLCDWCQIVAYWISKTS